MKLSHADLHSIKVGVYLSTLIFAIPFYFYQGGTMLTFAVVVLVSSIVNMLYVIGWHRWLTHNSFEPNTFGKYLMLFSIAIQGGYKPLHQITAHRLHHKCPDTEDDPHSPKFISLVGMILGRFNSNPSLLATQLTKRDFKNKELMFIHKNYYAIFFAFYATLLMIDVKTGLLFLGWTFTYMNTMSAVIAYFTHYDGEEYKPRNLSRLYSAFMCGEGLHKTHHEKPWAYSFESEEHPVDPGATFIRTVLIKRN